MPSVGESQDRGAGVDRLVSKGRGDGIGGFWRKGQRHQTDKVCELLHSIAYAGVPE